MIATTIQTLTDWAGGRLLQGDPSQIVRALSTDTRSIGDGEVFLALSGERFDGHEFLTAAAGKGARAFVISRELPSYPAGSVILVDDTLAALHKMAQAHRRAWGGIVVGLTGSNGKTSTKDLSAAVLSQNFRVRATVGNLNNHIGLPLTVLSMTEDDAVGIFEMGTNHPGEIAPLAAIAAPDVAVITNIGTAHIEHLKSREGIAAEKGALVEAVGQGGCVVLNSNDDFSPILAARTKASVLMAGLDYGDVSAVEVSSGAEGSRFSLQFPDGKSCSVHLPVPGRHMVGNAALAAAVGYYLGVCPEAIARGLESAALTKGRVQLRRVGGIDFIDDSYNANPESMRAALETLKSFGGSGRKIAVLGRMGELGVHSEREHLLLGAAAAAAADLVCTVGNDEAALIARASVSEGTDTLAFSTHADCAAHLSSTVQPGDVVLVKGSRSAGMDKVITEFQKRTCSTGSTN